jgi:hypothetical protein
MNDMNLSYCIVVSPVEYMMPFSLTGWVCLSAHLALSDPDNNTRYT